MRRNEPSQVARPRSRRGFTLAELILAGVITSFILGGVATSLSNLAQAKLSSRQRLEAHLRADAALEMIRRDVASIIRHDDLFFTRFLLIDSQQDTTAGRLDRDEMLVFANRLRQMRSIDYNGEGTQYELQYRLQDDEYAPTLWHRRDPFPDDYPRGGGLATPMVESVIGLKIEAYDGFQWRDEWDSDFEGVPFAVRITVTASGDTGDTDVYEAPFVSLRTVVSLDRILLPRESLAALYEVESAEDEGAEDEAGAGCGAPSLEDLGIDPSQLPPGFNINSLGGPGGVNRLGPNEEVFSVPGEAGRPTNIRVRDPNSGGSDVRVPASVRPGTGTSSTGSSRGGSSGGGGRN